ncbi:MAG: 30S ribosomal protein S2, partial [Coxiella endosymbiont of Haemaphysalis japonica]
MVDITMHRMLEAGVHFGHQTRYWNPKMAPYIYGTRQKIHIINLEKTLLLFREALVFIRDVALKRGRLLFVATKCAAREIVKEEAVRCGMPYVDYRWLGGMLTNYKTIRQSIKRLKELEERLENEDDLVGMTKKEILNLMREKDK